tara:strand:+ start:625 stop:1284 length:660 start_codon:yes stop_codon:yes gene_type:complete
MKNIILEVLNEFSDGQINLSSKASRETIATLISATLKSKGYNNGTNNTDGLRFHANHLAEGIVGEWECNICGGDTSNVEYDYIGSGTNHLECELKTENEEKEWPGLDTILTTSDSEVIESPTITREELVEQAYREVTADGLPSGGDIEAMKLAESIVDGLKPGDYIFESPDNGKHVFRRKFQDYDPKNKEEIDWETKKPTGRMFNEYKNGNWSDDENQS